MKTRVISAAVMLTIVGVCVLSPYTRLLLVLFIACAGLYEMSHACLVMGRPIPKWRMMGYPVLSAGLCLLKAPDWAFTALFVGYVLFLLCAAVADEKIGAEGVMTALFALCYPGLLITCVMRIVYSENWAVVCCLACFATWLCDAFALFGGMAFGKHKLCPNVSPKKTWEGSVTGALFSLLGGVLVYYVIPGAPALWQCLAVSLYVSTLGQFGDLAASLIKRISGLKDYSNLIPGHGGVMDRVDSLLFSIPSAWLLLKLFEIIGI